jgi:hypothetical protein
MYRKEWIRSRDQIANPTGLPAQSVLKKILNASKNTKEVILV